MVSWLGGNERGVWIRRFQSLTLSVPPGCSPPRMNPGREWPTLLRCGATYCYRLPRAPGTPR